MWFQQIIDLAAISIGAMALVFVVVELLNDRRRRRRRGTDIGE